MEFINTIAIAIAVILITIFIGLIISILYGDRHWQAGTHTLRQGLTSTPDAIPRLRYDPHELEPLPIPVQRYFEAVLKPGQPMIVGLQMTHRGEFNLSDSDPKWLPFQSDQVNRMHPIGFDWDARIAIAPGLNCLVHDAYVAGEGILNATLCGLIPLVNIQGTPDVAQGELQRFLAESAWYPTALLPSQGVSWNAIDDHRARACLTDGETTAEIEFRFGEDHLIQEFYTPSRPRTIHGQITQVPWGGKVWNYEQHDQLLIPIDGEVAWQLPEGRLPYWRGTLSKINYELTLTESLPSTPLDLTH